MSNSSTNPKGTTMKWENSFAIEEQARTARRELINAGVPVSLLSYNPMSLRYIFDSAKAASGNGTCRAI